MIPSVYLKSNPVFRLWKVGPCSPVSPAVSAFWHRKDVDMTAHTHVESPCKYSSKIKAESHPLVVRSCHLHLHHSVQPALQSLSDICSKKAVFFFCLFVAFFYCATPSYSEKLQVCLGWWWTSLPLACQIPAGRPCLIFWRKNPVNHGFKLWITHLWMKQCETLVCPCRVKKRVLPLCNVK